MLGRGARNWPWRELTIGALDRVEESLDGPLVRGRWHEDEAEVALAGDVAGADVELPVGQQTLADRALARGVRAEAEADDVALRHVGALEARPPPDDLVARAGEVVAPLDVLAQPLLAVPGE